MTAQISQEGRILFYCQIEMRERCERSHPSIGLRRSMSCNNNTLEKIYKLFCEEHKYRTRVYSKYGDSQIQEIDSFGLLRMCSQKILSTSQVEDACPSGKTST